MTRVLRVLYIVTVQVALRCTAQWETLVTSSLISWFG